LQHIGINITHQTEKNILKKRTLSSLFCFIYYIKIQDQKDLALLLQNLY